MIIHRQRLVPLEAYRGIAAFIVLVHHFFLGFSPGTTGFLIETRSNKSLIGEPYFMFFNGAGAVSFFFVLSGFVLCWSYFHDENQDKLMLAFLKRLPRLMALVVITTIASYLLFRFDYYHFLEASKVSKSTWLGSFAYAGWTDKFEPSFIKALVQGMTTFFTGSSTYNSSLWTMKQEFFGSMIVYLLAGFVVAILRRNYLPYAFLVLSFSTLYYSSYLFSFVIGVFLSALLSAKKITLPISVSVFIILLGFYLLGFVIPEKAYSWLNLLPRSLAELLKSALNSIGAALIIFATMCNKKIFSSMDGALGRFFGKLSFPFYLIHVLVICSISSYFFLLLEGVLLVESLKLLAVFTLTVVISVGFSYPLSKFDDWWVSILNSLFQRWAGNSGSIRTC